VAGEKSSDKDRGLRYDTLGAPYTFLSRTAHCKLPHMHTYLRLTY